MEFRKPTKIRSKKITQSAKGEDCTLRIPTVCNGNTTTTIFAHIPGNKGTATKNHDIFGVYCCSACHDWMDRRIPESMYHFPSKLRYKEILRALQETQLKLVNKGLIKILCTHKNNNRK